MGYMLTENMNTSEFLFLFSSSRIILEMCWSKWVWKMGKASASNTSGADPEFGHNPAMVCWATRSCPNAPASYYEPWASTASATKIWSLCISALIQNHSSPYKTLTFLSKHSNK